MEVIRLLLIVGALLVGTLIGIRYLARGDNRSEEE